MAPLAAAPQSKSIEGTWQGTLQIPSDKGLRTMVKISKGADGKLTGQFYSLDQDPTPIPLSSVSFDGGMLRFGLKMFDISYEGKMSGDGNTITGTSTQGGNSLPLNLERATAETAWEIPKPPAPLKPMPADANPSFDVATIKPSKPDDPGKMFRVNGRNFSTKNTTLTELVTFAYGLHPKQMLNAPPWMETDKFDLSATPDRDGAPSDAQWKAMLQKLLADRFQLKFTREQRELNAYVLTQAKGGQKMDKSPGDPNGLPGLWFTGPGRLNVTNATMDDFCNLMQQVVLDRPVADHTGIQGRWNFNLKWTPDESQFSGMKMPTPKETGDPAPPLFTAMPEQIGLRLQAEKATVPVLVINHVEKPEAN